MRMELVTEGAVMSSGVEKSAPAVIGGTVSGLTVFGVPIPDFVQLLTAIYLAVMILHLLWKWGCEWRDKGKL